MSAFALELEDISKRFPGVVANDRVQLQVRAGSVHALVGENGAGKTTLMRIAYGMTRADHGIVRIQGLELGVGGTHRAIDLGLGMVHQHFMLVPTLSVCENVALGSEPRHGPWFDRDAARRHVIETAERFGLQLDPDARVEDLSVGEQQRVEIVKVLVRGARVLILDEPTAVLTPQEVDELFAILRRLVDEGHTVVMISHRLQEVLAFAEVITVMRDGRVVGDVVAADADAEKLAAWIVGREVPMLQRRSRRAALQVDAEVVLRCEGLCTFGARGALHDLSLSVRRGEILGIAGVEGNGQQALANVLVGLETPTSGRLLLRDEEVTTRSTAERRRRGMAYVPADRLREGLIEAMRVDENAILGRQHEPELNRGPWLRSSRIAARALKLLRRFEVRPAIPELPAAALSGGNQQRLVVGRELERDPSFLLLAQPTRGVDVGGMQFLHECVVAARDVGRAILLISADLNEILLLADRILVLFEGRVVGEVTGDAADPAQLGMWMTGSMEGPG
jgi:simple sugar transport system ATP-binding protein